MSDPVFSAWAKRALSLPDDAREQFARELERAGVSPLSLPIVARSSYLGSSDPEPAAPLSFAQERLWFLQEREPASAEYNLMGAFACTGAFDAAALDAAFRRLIARHQILRTRIAVVEGRAEQRIEPRETVAYPQLQAGCDDLTSLTPDAARARVEEAIRRERALPFDLSRAPLLRVRLLKLAEREHVVVLVLHHIIADAWSFGPLLRELADGYRQHQEPSALATVGQNPSEPAESASELHYADFACWQRAWLRGSLLERDLAHWRSELGGAEARLDLPRDARGPADARFNGGLVRRRLPVGLASAVDGEARRRGATPYMLLLAAFQLLLHRLTGQRDLCVGTSSADRPRPETEALIGFFVNTLVLRARFEDNPTGAELFARVRKTVVAALEHAGAPFEKVVAEWRAGAPAEGADALPFRCFFVLQTAPAAALQLPGLELRAIETRERPARFDLSLRLHRAATGAFEASLEFDTRLFSRASAERWLEQYERVLGALLERPERRISELDWFPPEWRRAPGPAPARDAAAPNDIIDSFLRQAIRRPEHAAVVSPDGALSYAELARAARRVRQALLERGVGAESRVLVCLPPGRELMATLLGVVWARGVYVPLDEQWPPLRLLAIARDGGARLLVTAAGQLPDEVLREFRRAEISVSFAAELSGDLADERAGGAELRDLEPPRLHPQSLAYIMYTSGSSGRPKAVGVTHAGVLAYVAGVLPRLRVSSEARLLWLSSIGADLGYTSVWVACCSGRTLQCVDRGLALDGDGLAEFLRRCPADGLKVAPSQLRALLDSSGSPAQILPRELLVLGGEAPPRELVRRVRALAPRCRIINHYGPTEATIGVTSFEIDEATLESELPIPLGHEFAPVRAEVFDAYGQPLPEGVPGELWLGGPSLARGYLGQPALTAERFVPNPAGEPGARCYRSGDQVVSRAGVLTFQGRRDGQLNLHGHRIEPEEIARCLRREAGVSDARVVVEDDGAGRQLVAYLVCAEPDAIDVAALQSRLEAELPRPLVPRRYRALERWPLLGTGKIDARGLSARAIELGGSASATASDAQGSAAPLTLPWERELSDIWQQVLQRESVTASDNFFALGGDSIQSLQIVARARRAGILITPKDVFDHPTLGALARAAKPLAGAAASGSEAVSGALRLTPIQHWFFEQARRRPAHFNQSKLLAVPAGFPAARLGAGLPALIGAHDVLRLRFVRDGRSWRAEHVELQAWLRENGPSLWTQHDLRGEERVGRAARIEAECAALQAGLDLERGRLLRLCHFDCGQSEPGRLFIVAHHLIVDAVSWRILLEDLDALLHGRALGPETSSYQSWAEALAQHAQSDAVRAELAFWSQQREPELLPRDTEGENLQSTLASHTRELSVAATDGLQALAAAARVGLDAVLLGALARVLCEHLQSDRITIECEAHGRQAIAPGLDLSRTIGWFTSRYPVEITRRARFGSGSRDDALRELTQVQAELVAAPQQGIGFGLLRYLSGPHPELTRRRRPDVSYNYLGRVDRGLERGFWDDASGATESSGSQRDPESVRTEALALQAVIYRERLSLTWLYSRALHTPDTISRLAGEAFELLRALAELEVVQLRGSS